MDRLPTAAIGCQLVVGATSPTEVKANRDNTFGCSEMVILEDPLIAIVIEPTL